MSIQSEIDRIEQNVADTYSVLSEAGAPMPNSMDSDNLAGTAANIAAVLYNKNQSLTAGQKAQARKNIDTVSYKGVWSASDSYVRNDVVFYNGASWICVAEDVAVPSGIEPGTDDSWQIFAEKGKTGPRGPAYTLTETDKNTIAAAVKASLEQLTLVGTDEDGVEHTWTIYGV